MNTKMQKYYSITIYNTFGAGLQDNFLGKSIFILCINKYYSKKDPQISPELSDSIDKSIEQPLSSKESIHLAAQI